MSKRSRTGDAALNDAVQKSKGERLKRRRTESEVGSQSELVLARDPTDALNAVPATNGCLAETASQSEPWSLSQAIAGHYCNLDPLFSPDEQYLFLSVETAIHIYSVATSRLFRVLQINPGSSVIGYKLSPINPEHLHVITSSGSVSEWNWVSGKQVGHWDSQQHKTVAAEIVYGEPADNRPPSLFSLRERKDGKREITVGRLSDQEHSTAVILDTNTKINHLMVTEEGRTVIAYGAAYVCFGISNFAHESKSIQYTWREVCLPLQISCVDIRQNFASKQKKSRSVGDKTSLEHIDIVFGAADGSMLIYHDALSITGFNNSHEEDGNRAPRRLHWHRDPVMTVRWSKDGNYILSGGHESVMVLWQLDTGRKQFLPHLSSPICNITISPSGNSYAVKLADNRIMVLSARELQPSVTITGLQLCARAIKHSNQSLATAPLPPRAVTAVLHPQNPDQLLIAIPAYHSVTQEGSTSTASPVLQTYDIRSNTHISRQALARTNVTTLGVSPDGTQIVTPDIEHLGLSYDGKWLATVDTWSPCSQDVDALVLTNPGASGAPTDLEEIHLKFWRWKDSSNQWELVTRIEGPHFSSKGTVPVLDLVSHPQNHEFATIGSDAVLRFWRPSVRSRSGLKPDSADQTPETWRCRNTLDLGGYLETCNSGIITSASICFSQDGSVLAICMQSASANPGLAILVDVQNGEVRHSQVGVYSGNPCAASFLGSRLIVVTHQSAFIWDTVNDAVLTTGSLRANTLGGTERCLLAVNARTQTFAIASRCSQKRTTSKKPRNPRHDVRVYDVQTASLISQLTLAKDPVALLSNLHSSDYIIIDSAANIQRLGCMSKVPQSTNTDDMIKHSDSGLVSLFGSQRLDKKSSSISAVSTHAYPLESAGLSRVFGNAPPFVLPPSRIVFRDLVKALSA